MCVPFADVDMNACLYAMHVARAGVERGSSILAENICAYEENRAFDIVFREDLRRRLESCGYIVDLM